MRDLDAAMPRAWLGKRVFLEFEAAFQVTEVFVNGVRSGEHRGGYTGFSFDVTAALWPGGISSQPVSIINGGRNSRRAKAPAG